MPASDKASGWRIRCAPLMIVGGFLLYLLSIGPIAPLAAEGRLAVNNPVVRALYLPIGWAMQHSELVRDLIFAYLYRWGVRIS
jgi:hypothetical protein